MQRVPLLSYYLIIFQIVVLLTENCCKDELTSTFHLQTAVANNKRLRFSRNFQENLTFKKGFRYKIEKLEI